MSKKTYHDGANEERSAVIAQLRRDYRKLERQTKIPSVLDYIETRIKWLLGRNERYDAKAGGLGKR